jgi:hypothetical protein
MNCAPAAPTAASAALPPNQELFGGAMACCVPPGLVDASAMRQVPDNQEVFMVPGAAGACVIVELLDRQPGAADDACAAFFFEDLAKDNQATGSTVSSVSDAAGDAKTMASPAGELRVARQTLLGVQHVAKYKEADTNAVVVALGVTRLPAPYNTDVVISVSAPQELAAGGSEDRAREAADAAVTPQQAMQLLAAAHDTLVVRDFGLFVQS